MSLTKRAAIIVWVVSVAIGTRYVFGSVQSFGELQYLEYVTPYLAVISLAHAFVLLVFAQEARTHLSKRSLAITLLLATCGIAGSADPFLSLWWFSILLLWAWSLATLLTVFRTSTSGRNIFLVTLITLGVAQAVLAILQFGLQHSVGLSVLGEPIADVSTLGVAKVLLSGEKLLRPFGTFPHSNVLAGFLVVSFLALLSQKKRFSSLYPLLFHLSTGLILIAIAFSYSRSAWFATLCILVIFAVRSGIRDILPALTVTIIAITLFGSATLGRFNLQLQEQQIEVRQIGVSSSIELIKQEPLGVGLREFVPEMLARRPGLSVFFYQPVHNAFLLLMAEFGIFGLVILLVVTVRAALKHFSILGVAVVTPSILIFLSFDHYLITLSQGLGILGLFIIVSSFLRRKSADPKPI